MRAILADWLMEVSEEFLLKRDTFHRALRLCDLFLSKKYPTQIQKEQFQLIGITALFIASKQEEILVPRMQDYVNATDGGFSRQELLQMEQEMLQVL